MKRKQVTELHSKTVSELTDMLKDLKQQFVTARLKFLSGKQQKESISLLSDDVARVQSVLTAKLKEEQNA